MAVGANEQNTNSLDLVLRMRSHFTRCECGPAPTHHLRWLLFDDDDGRLHRWFWFTKKLYSHLTTHGCVRASVTLAICLLLTQFIIICYLLSSDSFSNASRSAASSPLLLFIVSILSWTACLCVNRY